MFALRCFNDISAVIEHIPVWRTVLRSFLRRTAAGGSVISRSGPNVTLLIRSAFAGVYGLWAMFCMPGLRVPFRLKVLWLSAHFSLIERSSDKLRKLKRSGMIFSQVPFLPSTKEQTLNVIKLLEGHKGRLADLGSGDGRLVTHG